jgi:prolyl oligopeptidase
MNVTAPSPEQTDPHLWLEEIDSPAAKAWVEAENARTMMALGDAQFEADREALLAELCRSDQVPWNMSQQWPAITRRGRHVYNVWKVATNPKGLWRRTRFESYRTASPEWEVLIDLDRLAREEGEDWVWARDAWLSPSHPRCLILLSRGGADVTFVREFDLIAKRFVTDGFVLPEGNHIALEWVDGDTLLVSSSLGERAATTCGLPRVVRCWRRDEPFEDADVVFGRLAGRADAVGLGDR